MNIQKTVVSLLLLFVFFHVNATVSLSKIFSDNMVLQRDQIITVWGWGMANEKITVRFHNQVKISLVDKDGRWKIYLDKEKAGGPFRLVVSGSSDVITLKNILVGDVWICSGQSNMEMPLAGWGKINNYEKEIATANYPKIRLITVQQKTANRPLSDITIQDSIWHACSPQTVSNFSSTAYFFARDIFHKTGVPVGLINTSWGGTVAEAWTSGEALKKMKDFTAQVMDLESQPDVEEDAVKKYENDFRAWQDKANALDEGLKNGKAFYAETGYETRAWKTMELPGLWETSGLPDLDGIVWYRKKIDLTAAWTGKNVRMSLGAIDDEDITYVNGVEVGRSTTWDEPRQYAIPSSLLKEGENIIAIRVVDNGGGGGLSGDSTDMYLKADSMDSISLKGEWSYKISVDFNDVAGRPQKLFGPNRPSVLFNAMIHPLIPFAFTGVIWYQGESNADRGLQYRQLFPALITDWRKQWRRGDFPFYFVQLAAYGLRNAEPESSGWAELREAQLKTLQLKNTGMAVAIDIGDAKDIHPKNKQEVGRRLALIARAKLYGEKIAFSGPLFKQYVIKQHNIEISFSNTAGGLLAKPGLDLKGFSIAAADRKFYRANAVIHGDKVIVWCSNVSKPVAVRYAWADNPDCNLYNSEGLPASPFRTDNWVK